MKIKNILYNLFKEFIKFGKEHGAYMTSYTCFKAFLANKIEFGLPKFYKIKIKNRECVVTVRSLNKIDLGTVRATFYHNFHDVPGSLNLKPKIIFDLGSNIGTTLIDFALKYPAAKIYGFEMDIDNYKLAKLNTRKYINVNVQNCAIWHENKELAYDGSTREDGYSVQESNDDSFRTVEGKSLSSLFEDFEIDRVDYLKMDIEGAEKTIFFSDDISWLDRVDAMNIELHGFDELELGQLERVLEKAGFRVDKNTKHWASIFAIK